MWLALNFWNVCPLTVKEGSFGGQEMRDIFIIIIIKDLKLKVLFEVMGSWALAEQRPEMFSKKEKTVWYVINSGNSPTTVIFEPLY